MLRAPQVAVHPQPFVRRAALYAAAEVRIAKSTVYSPRHAEVHVCCSSTYRMISSMTRRHYWPGASARHPDRSLHTVFGISMFAVQVLTALPPARLAGALLGGDAGSTVDAALVERLEWLRCHLDTSSCCPCLMPDARVVSRH